MQLTYRYRHYRSGKCKPGKGVRDLTHLRKKTISIDLTKHSHRQKLPLVIRLLELYLHKDWAAGFGLFVRLRVIAPARFGHFIEQALDHLIGTNPLGVGVEVREDAMSQDGLGHATDVFTAHVQAAV